MFVLFWLQIFFRAGTLAQLEDSRDEKLGGTVVDFQALCRGYLGRKNIKQKQVSYYEYNSSYNQGGHSHWKKNWKILEYNSEKKIGT